MKLPLFNLQNILIVLAIITVLLYLVLPNLMPGISKNIEAQTQLKDIYNIQQTYRYMYAKYSTDLNELDFETPKTVKQNGTGNYNYEVLTANNNSFKVRATAVTDFDGDGIFNVWEIDEIGKPIQIFKD